jgi:hypothetical protein
LKIPEQINEHFRYVCFSDTPISETKVWEIAPVTFFQNDPVRMARFIKIHPHMVLDDCDIAVWIDANILIKGDISPMVEGFVKSGKAVAAVPHYLRRSIYEEVDACVEFGKDNEEIMREQVARYLDEKFQHDDLIESSFIMFNLAHPSIRNFLYLWWTEIDRYSVRDQLSVNYALSRTGIGWHHLMDRPDTIYTHPFFSTQYHDQGKSCEGAWVDPYRGRCYTDVRVERIAAQRRRRIDVIVCVHLHGNRRIDRAVKSMKSNPFLERFRHVARILYQNTA